MKTVFIYSLLFFWVVSMNAQEVTQLEETKVTFEPFVTDVVSNLDNYSVMVNENYDGELTKTAQKFKNIPLPFNLRRELYTSYKGWNMVKNTYTASGKSDQIDKELYRIKLKNGNRSQIVKIVPERMGSDIVARD